MSELVVEPWTNEFGQTIKPGDEVIYAGTSWKSTTMYKGVFAGVRYANQYVTTQLRDENSEYIREDVMRSDGTPAGWKRIKTETKSVRAIVAVRVDKVDRGHKWGYVTNAETGKKEYKKLDEIQYGTATLPLKRVYKLDTTLNDLAGRSF